MYQHNNSKKTYVPAAVTRSSFLLLVLLLMQVSWQNASARDAATRAPGESRGRRNSPVTNLADPGRRREERNIARRNLWLPTYNRKLMTTTQPKEVAIETQIALGAPMIFPPDWQDSLLVGERVERLRQDIEKTENDSNHQRKSGVLNSAVNSTESSSNKGQSFSLHDGTALVNRRIPVEINSIDHQVNVKPGAIAYVVNMGKELAVYNLKGVGTDSVTIKSADAKHVFEVSKGTAIFITEAPVFSESTLFKFIHCKNLVSMATVNGAHVFSAKFSYIQALDACPQFRHCVGSKNVEEHRLAEELLKLSAARIVALSDD